MGDELKNAPDAEPNPTYNCPYLQSPVNCVNGQFQQTWQIQQIVKGKDGTSHKQFLQILYCCASAHSVPTSEITLVEEIPMTAPDENPDPKYNCPYLHQFPVKCVKGQIKQRWMVQEILKDKDGKLQKLFMTFLYCCAPEPASSEISPSEIPPSEIPSKTGRICTKRIYG